MTYLGTIIISILLLIILYKLFKYANYIPIVGYDNNTYYLSACKNCDDQLKESANALAKINERVYILIKYLQTNHPNHDVTKILEKNYSSNVLRETIPETQYTSYTENKSTISMCLRSRDDKKKLYDINLLMYIVLHELAHFCNYNFIGFPIVGHGEEFKKIFKFLVENSINANVYMYEDYRVANKNYCGLNLHTNIIQN